MLGPVHAEGARWGEPTRHTLRAAWEEGREAPRTSDLCRALVACSFSGAGKEASE